MEGYHESTTGSVTARATRPTLRPYEHISTPPITLVLQAIADHCDVGGSIAPGIRQLGEWSGVTLGLITDCLRQLDADGWITYNSRVIMLLQHPDQGDRSGDRSDGEEAHEVIDHLIDQSETTPAPVETSDRSGDRSDGP